MLIYIFVLFKNNFIYKKFLKTVFNKMLDEPIISYVICRICLIKWTMWRHVRTLFIRQFIIRRKPTYVFVRLFHRLGTPRNYTTHLFGISGMAEILRNACRDFRDSWNDNVLRFFKERSIKIIVIICWNILYYFYNWD